MQKPPFIKIVFPRGKRPLSPAVKRYFKGLADGEIRLHFCRLRQRKAFVYRVTSSDVMHWASWFNKSSFHTPVIVLDLDTEKTTHEI